MAMKYTNIFDSKTSKIYPNWDFCLKICHLATLGGNAEKLEKK
jgi:hypothetical protein